MSGNFVKSQGTELFFYDVSQSSSVERAGCVTNISGLGGAAAQIPTSCFNSEEDEFEGGRPSPGQIQISMNYRKDDNTFPYLVGLKDSRDVIPWNISGGDGTGTPTPNSDNELETASGRTGLRFAGYVADMTWNITDNDIWRVELTIQRSGPWRLDPASS
jgi:hypothetical protein